MAGNTAPYQEPGPRMLVTSFEPRVVALPPFLSQRIPLLSGPIEALEKQAFIPAGENGILPPGVDPIEGMPEEGFGDYDQVRSVKGTTTIRREDPITANAAAIALRNSHTLAERVFAETNNLEADERTFMDRRIEAAILHRPITNEEIRIYGEAMVLIGPLATSGCPTDPPDDNNIPQELRRQGLSIVPLVEGEHEGGFRYIAPGVNSQIMYLHKNNFMTPEGGLGRNFIVHITSNSIPVADLKGSTTLYFTPRPLELPLVAAD